MMSIDQFVFYGSSIIAIFASLATIAIAIMTWKTIQVMKTQQEASYKPMLHILNLAEKAIFQDHAFIINSGFGPAKEIEIEWQLDFEKIIAMLKERAAYLNTSCNLTFIGDEDGDVLLWGESYDDRIFEVTKDDLRQKIKLILQYSIDKEEKDLCIPDIYRYLMELFYVQEDRLINNMFCDPQKEKLATLLNMRLPETVINIKYKDMGNKLYALKFVVKFTWDTTTNRVHVDTYN